jgi:hypothetical protein
MTPELVAPEELRGQLLELLPRLAAQGVRKVHAFSDHRPGEPPHWVCFLFVQGRRRSVGTPDLRGIPLADQVPDLLRQLRGFEVPCSRIGVRAMMWLTVDCELPDYVPDAEFWPNDIITATVPADRLDELQLHPGVLSLVTHD